MAKISELESQFESQSSKEIERINEITKKTFNTIEQDLLRQLNVNHQNMKSVISQSEKALIKRMESKIHVINGMTKWMIWGGVFALMILALTASAWTFFLKDWMFENPYQNLQIESCGISMCAHGQVSYSDGEVIENVILKIYRKQ